MVAQSFCIGALFGVGIAAIVARWFCDQAWLDGFFDGEKSGIIQERKRLSHEDTKSTKSCEDFLYDFPFGKYVEGGRE